MKFLDVQPGAQIKLASSGSMPEQTHVFDKSSIHAVNAALAARRPLLVRGEPGVGKSQLARAAAAKLGRAYVQCVVDSRTEPRDLLWRFDAVTRLAEAQLAGAMREDSQAVREQLAVHYFVSPGPLWWVFEWESARQQAHKFARRSAISVQQLEPPQSDGGDFTQGCVLLVDEIDKAESDVPNGLLEALGAGQFTPAGSNTPVIAGASVPLVIITTNEERALPNAFVRRCLVLFLSLPGESTELIAMMRERGRAHFPDLDKRVFSKAAEILARDRNAALEQRVRPLPGQAEYLDLLRAIRELAPGDVDRQLETLDVISGFALKKQMGNQP
jgi:MoxR-like ATPase